MFFMLAFFTFEPDSIWSPWRQSSNLYILRLLGKDHDGVIHSRPYTNGTRVKLEHWKQGQLYWRHPGYDAIMKEQQDYLEQLCAFWNEPNVSVQPNDRMP